MSIHTASTRRRVGLALFALIMLPIGGVAVVRRDALVTRRFGPPRVIMVERHADAAGIAVFDHAELDELLRQHVDGAGWVDYRGLERDAARLDAYLARLALAPVDELSRDGRLAFLLNAYNACTLRLILDHWNDGLLESIRDIPASRRWKDRRWTIAGRTWSLHEIEHERIRPAFVEPRIHFALVCAAIGCPPLRPEAYAADRLESQLADQAAWMHRHATWFTFDPDIDTVRLTRLYDWYGGDFAQGAGSVLAFAARHADPRTMFAARLEAGGSPRIAWIEYDWRLNDVRHRGPR